jgi:predicted NBD/HSP70 family sugar kinase
MTSDIHTFGGSPPLLRQINQARVLGALRPAGAVRVGDVARLTGLSRPTVSDILEELHTAGWVAFLDEHPDGRNGLGRPARLVQFRSEAGYVIGIDIGAHRVGVSVADLHGRVVSAERGDTSQARGGARMLAVVRDTITRALRRAGVDRRAVMSVAVGGPGIIDPTTSSVQHAPGVEGWASTNVRAGLARSFRCPIHVENDLNLAVIGECWQGVARDASTVAYVGWGERIGAGISIDGRLHRGASSAAGEIGYLDILDASPDPDGVHREGPGGLERRVGAGVIAEKGQRAARRFGGPLAAVLRSGRQVDAAAVFTVAASGDPIAQEIVDQAVGDFARALAPLLLILDPDMLVIGGGISAAGPALLEALTGCLRRTTLVPPRIELSALGDAAVTLGAIRLALTDVEARLMPAIGTTP